MAIWVSILIVGFAVLGGYFLLMGLHLSRSRPADTPFGEIDADSFFKSPILSGKHVRWKVVALVIVITCFPAMVLLASLTDTLVTAGYLPKLLRPPHHHVVQPHSTLPDVIRALATIFVHVLFCTGLVWALFLARDLMVGAKKASLEEKLME
jgi:hypothetical protein